MNNVTMEKLNAGNNPEDFCGILVASANSEGAEKWLFGDKFAIRWNQACEVRQSVWNGFGIEWDDQIPLS